MSNAQLSNLPQKRLLFLDYIRVFAFLSVLIGHKFYDTLLSIIDNSSSYSALKLLVTLLLPFFMGGGAGVVVFFIVSGYIIIPIIKFNYTY
jgi:peptidoglycan/LPS O-acetylase OafA/YrhL